MKCQWVQLSIIHINEGKGRKNNPKQWLITHKLFINGKKWDCNIQFDTSVWKCSLPTDAGLMGWEVSHPKEEVAERHVSPKPLGLGSVEEAPIGSPDPRAQEGDRYTRPATVLTRATVNRQPSPLLCTREKSHPGPHSVVLWYRGVHPGRGWEWAASGPELAMSGGLWALLPLAQLWEAGSSLGHPAVSHENGVYQLKTCANKC